MFGKPQQLTAGITIERGYAIEPKVDGFRVLFSTNAVGTVAIAIGRKRDYTHHFGGIKLPHSCIFDAEVVVNGSLQETSKILSRNNATPYDTMQIYVFDILQDDLADLTLDPYCLRRARLDGLRWPMADARPIPMQEIVKPILVEKLAQPYIDIGWEGVVIKQLSQPYGRKWFKYKTQITEDFVVNSIDEGNGGWQKTAGRLKLWDPRSACDVGSCSVGSNENRVWFTNRMKIYSRDSNPIIVEVEYQQRTATNQLRHPRLLRVRHDLMETNNDI